MQEKQRGRIRTTAMRRPHFEVQSVAEMATSPILPDTLQAWRFLCLRPHVFFFFGGLIQDGGECDSRGRLWRVYMRQGNSIPVAGTLWMANTVATPSRLRLKIRRKQEHETRMREGNKRIVLE